MNEQINEFNDLISQAGRYLKSQLFYSSTTINQFRKEWKRIRGYMFSKGIKHYSEEVEKQVLDHEFKGRSIRSLTSDERRFHNCAKMLTEFQQAGKISVPARPRKEPLIFSGAIGQVITSFLDYKRTKERLSLGRLDCYQRFLFRFLTYCDKNGIRTIESVDLIVILQYIEEQDCSKQTPIYLVISTLRGFMKYVFNQNLSPVDYSIKIPKYKFIKQPKLPSTYSQDEIEKLITSVDRYSAIGKRNYAIILLAARLGLRASDISRLRFDNLHWETSTLEMKQYKTGKELTLPLLPDVGNAIIDYLKYGRPKSEEPYVFLTERPPYGHFRSSNIVTHIVQRAFKHARINIKDRKFGAHSLRHSLGFRMLEESTVLPVISEVLGHQSTESTRYYLRIDIKSMRKCMLEVPLVTTGFYQQKGGAFYEYE